MAPPRAKVCRDAPRKCPPPQRCTVEEDGGGEARGRERLERERDFVLPEAATSRDAAGAAHRASGAAAEGSHCATLHRTASSPPSAGAGGCCRRSGRLPRPLLSPGPCTEGGGAEGGVEQEGGGEGAEEGEGDEGEEEEEEEVKVVADLPLSLQEWAWARWNPQPSSSMSSGTGRKRKKEELKEDEDDNARAPDPGVDAPMPQVLEQVVELVLVDYIVTCTLVLTNFCLDGAFSEVRSDQAAVGCSGKTQSM